MVLSGLTMASVVRADTRTAGPTAEAAKKKPKRTYCTKKRRPKGCVKPPKGAERPADVGSSDQVPTPPDVANGGGLGGGPGVNRLTALEWAQSQRGSKIWSWHCQRFVEEAYGTRQRFKTAASAARALKLTRSSVTNAPRGALIYFAADTVNRRFGHVGISLGDGRMISALDRVRVSNVARSGYWRSRYLGWAQAPADWPGRIPPPPAVISDFDSNASVRITAPAPSSELSGTEVPLLASASGVGGVAFDAYFASNPRDPGSRGWKPLGIARPDQGSWSLAFDTTQIPDQGTSRWGTVNIAAIALDSRGRRTGVRDYRRVDINNTATPLLPPTPGTPELTTSPTSGTTPQTPTTATPQTYPQVAGGYANTWSDYRSAGGTPGPGIHGGSTVHMACRLEGFRVSNGNTWWYRIAQAPWNHAFYATADAFYNNGQTSGSLLGTPYVDTAVPLC